jgi:exonuclease SbcD
MIRFIHTADIHFGMENYGRLDVKTGIHSRLLDFQKALNYCIDHAIEHSIDFFLFSGDAYKTAHPSPTQQKLLLQCFLRLHKAGIPVVIVVGNHDNPLSFGKANSLDVFGELPIEGFHVIAKPTILSLQTKNGLINIVGIPWPTRNTIALNDQQALASGAQITEYISKAVGAIIRSFAQKLDPSIPAVLAGHLTVSSGVFSGSEKRAIYGTDPLLFPSDLAIEPFDYVALGHLHRYQNLNANGYPAIVYSGSIERVDFGERKEEKGFCVVSIPCKNEAVHEFVKVPTRPFIQIEVVLAVETKESSHTDQMIAVVQRRDITDAVIKIMYHVPPGIVDHLDLGRIQRACSAAWYIVGIIPVREIAVREHRAAVTVGMDLPVLLRNYFATRADIKDRADDLIEKTLQLEQEVQEMECESE